MCFLQIQFEYQFNTNLIQIEYQCNVNLIQLQYNIYQNISKHIRTSHKRYDKKYQPAGPGPARSGGARRTGIYLYRLVYIVYVFVLYFCYIVRAIFRPDTVTFQKRFINAYDCLLQCLHGDPQSLNNGIK